MKRFPGVVGESKRIGFGAFTFANYQRFPGLEFFGYGVAETGFRMLQFG